MEERVKIKILYTIPNFDTAGSGKVVYDLVKGLDKDSFEVEIACRHNGGAFFKEVEALNVPIHIIKITCSYKPYSSLFFRLIPIVKFFKKNRYDIIHSWNWSSDWTEVLAARLSGAKWLYTKKAMSWGNQHWRIRSFLADYIITINDEMKAYFSYKKNQKLVPLGIDAAFYSPALFPSKRTLNDNFNIITIANLVPVKGIEVLIKSLSILNNPIISLVVLGDDASEYGEYLKSLVQELNLESQVCFVGKKSDVRSYIAESDLYVIPSIDKGEGMPMALVEAMSMAVPVLGSDISGINFVLKDFQDLLFEAGNPWELSKAIESIRKQDFEQRKKLGLKLRNYVLNNFSYEDFIHAHQTLYTEILK